MKFYHVFAALCFTSTIAIAAPDVQITGKVEQVIQTSNQAPRSTRQMFSYTPSKIISLMGIELSHGAWENLTARTEHMHQNASGLTHALNTNQIAGHPGTQLGMNKVPVLDQGKHGSCATFANTAALDAALGQGDYISQLCHLQLGRRLESLGYTPSGWDGSLGPTVLHQIQVFGVINKDKQHDVGCGGAHEYPRDDSLPENDMSFSEYHRLSEPLLDNDIAWTPLLDIYGAFLDKRESDDTLATVKHSLKNKDRLTFGVLLFAIDQGVVGATGKYHSENDTWVLTPEITEAIMKKKNFGGHEMIITGFNDYAVAIDKNGVSHRGLLTLRNSWGTRVGDQGDFYMSYDYFKLLAIEVQRIRSSVSL